MGIEQPRLSDSCIALAEDGLITVAEAARFLAVSRTTIYELMAEGVLPSAKIGRARRIAKRAVVELAAASFLGVESNDG